MKIVKIENCMECKYHISSQMTDGLIYCQHEEHPYYGHPVIPDFPRIPDWCELEDDLAPVTLSEALDVVKEVLND